MPMEDANLAEGGRPAVEGGTVEVGPGEVDNMAADVLVTADRAVAVVVAWIRFLQDLEVYQLTWRKMAEAAATSSPDNT